MAEAQPALPFPTAGSFATYRVGGAVRDRLLGRAPGDEDFVVVGASQAAMHALGFRAVGRDFPVFLHPQTHAEYALARTERKSGRGYRGFVVDADPSVTLEDDLRRRDLTINAIAEDAQGRIIDPFGGRATSRPGCCAMSRRRSSRTRSGSCASPVSRRASLAWASPSRRKRRC